MTAAYVALVVVAAAVVLAVGNVVVQWRRWRL